MKSPHVSPLPVAVVGDDLLAQRLGRAGWTVARDAADARVVVVAGATGQRAEVARAAASDGAHVFLTWPPGISALELGTVGARAEEAGVEVGVGRPLGTSALLAGRPDGWTARLVSLSLVATPGGPLHAAGWPTLLAGALDLCAALSASRDVASLDAEADREGADLRAVLFAVRFRTGAFAQGSVRTSSEADADEVSLYASRPGTRIEARSLDGPLCVETEGQPSVRSAAARTDDSDEVMAFLRAVDAGGRPPYALGDALATLRLVERLQQRLR